MLFQLTHTNCLRNIAAFIAFSVFLISNANGNGFRVGKIVVRPIIVDKSQNTDRTHRLIAAQSRAIKHIYGQIGIEVEFADTQALQWGVAETVPLHTADYSAFRRESKWNLQKLFISDFIVGMPSSFESALKSEAGKVIVSGQLPLFYAPPIFDFTTKPGHMMNDGTTFSWGSFVWIRANEQGAYYEHELDTAAHELMHLLLRYSGDYVFVSSGDHHLKATEQLMCPIESRTQLAFPKSINVFNDDKTFENELRESLSQAAPIGRLCQISNEDIEQNRRRVSLVDLVFASSFVRDIRKMPPALFRFESSRSLDDTDRPTLLKNKIAPVGFEERLTAADAKITIALEGVHENPAHVEAKETTTTVPVELSYVDLSLKSRRRNAGVFDSLGFPKRPEAEELSRQRVSNISISAVGVSVSNIAEKQATAEMKIKLSFSESPFAKVHPTDGRQTGKKDAQFLPPRLHCLRFNIDEIDWLLPKSLSGFVIKPGAPYSHNAHLEGTDASAPKWTLFEVEGGKLRLQLEIPQGVNESKLPETEYTVPLRVFIREK